MEDYNPLTVAEYAADAARTDRGVEGQSLAFPLLGLAGEVGSLLSELKKKQRDPASYRSHSDAVTEELGDVLWYLALYEVTETQLSFAGLEPPSVLN